MGGAYRLSYTAVLESGGVAGTKAGDMRLPSGALMRAGASQRNTDAISTTGLAADRGSVSGGSESSDGSGGGAGVGASAVIGGESGTSESTATGGGKTDWSIAASPVGAPELVAWVLAFVPRSSGRRSGGHPAGRPVAAGGWKSNGAAPTAGR